MTNNLYRSLGQNWLLICAREQVIRILDLWELMLRLDKAFGRRLNVRLHASLVIFLNRLLLRFYFIQSFFLRKFQKASGGWLFGGSRLRQMNEGSWANCDFIFTQVVVCCCKVIVLTFIVPWIGMRYKWGVLIDNIRAIGQTPSCWNEWILVSGFIWLFSKQPKLLIISWTIDKAYRGGEDRLLLIDWFSGFGDDGGLLKSFVKLAITHIGCLFRLSTLLERRALWSHSLSRRVKPRPAQVRFGDCTLHPVEPADMRDSNANAWHAQTHWIFGWTMMRFV